MAQYLEPAIGEFAAGILAEVQVLELGHPRELQQAVIAEFARPAEVQARHVIQFRDVFQDRCRSSGRWRPAKECAALEAQPISSIPVRVRTSPATRRNPIVLTVDVVWRTLWRSPGCSRLHQRFPTSKPSILRDNQLRFLEQKVVPTGLESALPEGVHPAPDLCLDVLEGEPAAVILIQTLESRVILRIRLYEVLCGLKIFARCAHSRSPILNVTVRLRPSSSARLRLAQNLCQSLEN